MSDVPPERIFINYPPEDFNDPWFFQSDFGNTEYISLAAHEKAVAEARRETSDLRKVVLDHVSDLKGCVAAFEESEYRDSFARTTASIREAITELEAAAKGEQ